MSISNGYAVIRQGGGWDIYAHAPTRNHINRAVSDHPMGPFPEASPLALRDTVPAAAWYHRHGRASWNVVATCVATILGAARLALPGDVVFTGWSVDLGMTGLSGHQLDDIKAVRDAVVRVLQALPPRQAGELRSPLAPTTTIMDEAVAGSVRRWAAEIPTLPRNEFITVPLPEGQQ